MVKCEVAYIDATGKVSLIKLEVPTNATIKDAITQSGILKAHPEIDLEQQAVGLFSKRCTLDTLVTDNARIEIYRPLSLSPMERRRLLAEKKKDK